jgi:hypothetical protein
MTLALALATETDVNGTDKIVRYGWKAKDEQGEFRMIPKRLLNVNREIYQREGYKSKVQALARSWSWISCGALVVAQRENIYWVVDGMHRSEAAKSRADIKDLPCLVFQVESVEEEARAFLATNVNRRNVSAHDKYRACLGAGDEIAQLVQAAINNAGLRLSTASKEPRAFKSIALAQTIAASDFDGLVDVLAICGELAADEKCPVHARLLSGLYYIHRRVEGGLANTRLRKRILQIGARQLVAGANKAAAYYGLSGSKVCAEGMLQVINSGLQKKFSMGAEAAR